MLFIALVEDGDDLQQLVASCLLSRRASQRALSGSLPALLGRGAMPGKQGLPAGLPWLDSSPRRGKLQVPVLVVVPAAHLRRSGPSAPG